MPNIESVDTTTMLVILILVGIISFLLFRPGRTFGGKVKNEPSWPSQAAIKTRQQIEAAPDLNPWKVEMFELARDFKAQLDSKMRALQILIADADRAADRLEEAMKNRDGESSPRPDLPKMPENKA
jgi:hypothetical protein